MVMEVIEDHHGYEGACYHDITTLNIIMIDE